MGKEEIRTRILEDAEREAEELVSAAEAEAEEILAAARAQAERERAETERDTLERAKKITEGEEAAARLEGGKILLAGKRRVLDEIYARALKELTRLSERDGVRLYDRLIREFAERGDEIVLARGCPYAEKIASLPVFSERGLTLSRERAPFEGGFLLRGERCDRDLSFSALLAADREEHQAELAQKLFRK